MERHQLGLFSRRGFTHPFHQGNITGFLSLQDGLLYPANTISVFYNDIPLAEAEYWNPLLVPKSADQTSVDVATVCYDLDIPTTCILCTDEPLLPMLESMVAKVKRRSWQVVRIAGGHSPFRSRKEELVGIVQRCLGLERESK